MSDTDVKETTAEIPQQPAAEATQPPPTPEQVLQVVLYRFAAFDPRLAATGLAALRALEDLHEEKPRGFWKWRHGGVIKRYVERLVPRFRDPESITELGDQLIHLASRLLKPRGVTPEQCAVLRKMAVKAKPSEISRLLLAWRYDISDRAVRHLQERKIAVCYWR